MFKKASIVIIALLLSIVFFYDYKDFYQLNRIFCCSFFAYTAYIAYKNKLEWLTLMLFILAVLYNPFYNLFMEEAKSLISITKRNYRYSYKNISYLWVILNLLSVAVILYTNYVFKNKKICDTIFDRKNKDK